jgi:hypothetical protein
LTARSASVGFSAIDLGWRLATGGEIADHVRSLDLAPRVFPQPEIR